MFKNNFFHILNRFWFLHFKTVHTKLIILSFIVFHPTIIIFLILSSNLFSYYIFAEKIRNKIISSSSKLDEILLKNVIYQIILMVMIVYTFVIYRKKRQDKKRHKSIQCWVGVELFNLYVRTTLYQRRLARLNTLSI